MIFSSFNLGLRFLDLGGGEVFGLHFLDLAGSSVFGLLFLDLGVFGLRSSLLGLRFSFYRHPLVFRF